MIGEWKWPPHRPREVVSPPPILPRKRPAIPSVVTDVFEGTIPEDDTPDIKSTECVSGTEEGVERP